MTILALIIALVLEQLGSKTSLWHIQDHSSRYYSWLANKAWLSSDKTWVHWFLAAFIPALLTSVVITWLPNSILSFALQTLILFICVGSQTLRNTYKCFLQAANRGDLESCYLFTQQMGHCDSKPDQASSFGLRLVWLNYQNYGGVIIAFIAFGAPGAIFYTLVREGFTFACETEEFSTSASRAVRHWVDWLPVRIVSFGMLLVGNFAHGLSVWLGALFDFKESAISLLTRVSSAAEVMPSEESKVTDPTKEPIILVKLAKRNMVFILVLVSLLTVFGVL